MILFSPDKGIAFLLRLNRTSPYSPTLVSRRMHPSTHIVGTQRRAQSNSLRRITSKMLLLDYQNVLIQSVLTERFTGYERSYRMQAAY